MIPTQTRQLSDRLRVITVPPPRAASFADDVRAGLRAKPKSLSSKYFYDATGSALFEAITHLPEYYLTRAETEILAEWGWEIVRVLGNPIEFVELGSGSAAKTRILIEEALRVQGTLQYSPIDISAEALTLSAQALVESYPGLTIHAYAGDYFSVLERTPMRENTRVMYMFMGSNIGNYEPAQAVALLRTIRQSLREGDGLLLGADLKKKAKVLELAYDDPTGVTAAFNLNLLGRINRELGGAFKLDRFKYRAQYQPSHGRIKSSLISKREQTVAVKALGEKFRFRKGESIHTESSYKYSPEDLLSMANQAGYAIRRSWYDRKKRFSVNLLVRS